MKIVFNTGCHAESDSLCDKLKGVITNTITQTLISEGLEGIKPEVCVTLTDNDGIRELNKTYRQIDRETDCLSFPQYEKEQIDKMREQSGENGGNKTMDGSFDKNRNKRRLRRYGAGTARFANTNMGRMLGDIVISFEKAQAQAEEYNHLIEREIAFLAAHSALHLLGYDHMNYEDEKQMAEKQENILGKLGYARYMI
jgi:probable rRNA maturation factor